MYSGYSKIFQDSSNHFAFDERSNIYGRRLFRSGNISWFHLVYSKCELLFNKLRYKFFLEKNKGLIDFTRITTNEAKNNRIKLFQKDLVKSDLWFKKKKIQNWTIDWEDGKLLDKVSNNEYLHFHLIDSKRNKKFYIENWSKNKHFQITEKGITLSN